jgi:hypothetical protein
MKHVVPHDLDPAQAKKAAEAALAAYAERFAKYQPKATWVSPTRATISFQVKGMTLQGALELQAKSFEMDLEVPFLLRPFKGMAIGVIEDEIKSWVKRVKAGEV